MLELLSLRKGTTLTKEMFLNHLYGGMDEPRAENHRRVHLQAAQEAGERQPWPPITSRRYGDAATCCASRARKTIASPPDRDDAVTDRTPPSRVAFPLSRLVTSSLPDWPATATASPGGSTAARRAARPRRDRSLHRGAATGRSAVPTRGFPAARVRASVRGGDRRSGGSGSTGTGQGRLRRSRLAGLAWRLRGHGDRQRRRAGHLFRRLGFRLRGHRDGKRRWARALPRDRVRGRLAFRFWRNLRIRHAAAPRLIDRRAARYHDRGT